jgi:hypothetical protein
MHTESAKRTPAPAVAHCSVGRTPSELPSARSAYTRCGSRLRPVCLPCQYIVTFASAFRARSAKSLALNLSHPLCHRSRYTVGSSTPHANVNRSDPRTPPVGSVVEAAAAFVHKPTPIANGNLRPRVSADRPGDTCAAGHETVASAPATHLVCRGPSSQMTADSRFLNTWNSSSLFRAKLRRSAGVLKYRRRAKLGRVPAL